MNISFSTTSIVHARMDKGVSRLTHPPTKIDLKTTIPSHNTVLICYKISLVLFVLRCQNNTLSYTRRLAVLANKFLEYNYVAIYLAVAYRVGTSLFFIRQKLRTMCAVKN